MSYGPLEKIRRNIGVRLGLWSALIFALSSIALLALAYYLLAAAVGSKDRELLLARLRERGLMEQSIALLSYALPEREAVWWGGSLTSSLNSRPSLKSRSLPEKAAMGALSFSFFPCSF